MIMISHSNTLPSSTSPAEKPSTGCLFKSATRGAGVLLVGCSQRAEQRAACAPLSCFIRRRLACPDMASCASVGLGTRCAR